MKFTEWLRVRESRFASALRPELDIGSQKKLEFSIGDVVELGPESEHKGKSVTRIGQIIEIRANDVLVRDLTRMGRNYSIPFSDLYDKEDLKGILLTPREERDLKSLGGKKIWVRLTPRQYKKFKSKYKADMPMIVGDDSSESPSKELRRMFAKPESEPEVPMKIFEPEKSKYSSPLRRFTRKDLF